MWGFLEQKSQELFAVLAPELSPADKLFVDVEQGDIDGFRLHLQQLPAGSSSNVASLTNSSGNKLIHVAALNAQERFVRVLVDEYSVDVATCGLGRDGNSCLHFAAMSGNVNLVKYFVERGISPCLRNAEGRNAYDVAQGFGLKQMLMPLIFAEEERTGTAPQIEGATRDPRKDAERLKYLPPPPPQATGVMGGDFQQQYPPPPPPTAFGDSSTMAAVGPAIQAPAFTQAGTAPPSFTPAFPAYQTQMRQNRPAVSRPIQPDGFVTTVGNEALAKKYGNASYSSRNTVTPPPPPGQLQMSTATALPTVTTSITAAAAPPPPQQFGMTPSFSPNVGGAVAVGQTLPVQTQQQPVPRYPNITAAPPQQIQFRGVATFGVSHQQN